MTYGYEKLWEEQRINQVDNVNNFLKQKYLVTGDKDDRILIEEITAGLKKVYDTSFDLMLLLYSNENLDMKLIYNDDEDEPMVFVTGLKLKEGDLKK